MALAAALAAVACNRAAAPLLPGSILVASAATPALPAPALQIYDAPTLLPLSRLRLPGPVVSAIPAGPGAVALVLGAPANSMRQLDLRHFTLGRRLALPFEPSSVLTAGPRAAYVAGTDNSGWGRLALVNLESFQVLTQVRVGRQPVSLALSPDHTDLLVADPATNSIHILNAASLHRLARLSLPFAPRQVLTLPYGHQAFALGPTQVAALDWQSAGLLCLLPVGASPQFMVLKPDGGELYVSNAAGTISVVDTSTDVVSATLPAGAGASGLAVASSGASLYIANSAAGTVSVLDLATRRQIAVVRVGEEPASLTLGPAGQYLFVADRASDDLAVLRSSLDPNNPNSLVTLLPAPPQPRVLLATSGARP